MVLHVSCREDEAKKTRAYYEKLVKQANDSVGLKRNLHYVTSRHSGNGAAADIVSLTRGAESEFRHRGTAFTFSIETIQAAARRTHSHPNLLRFHRSTTSPMGCSPSIWCAWGRMLIDCTPPVTSAPCARRFSALLPAPSSSRGKFAVLFLPFIFLHPSFKRRRQGSHFSS